MPTIADMQWFKGSRSTSLKPSRHLQGHVRPFVTMGKEA